MSRPTGSPATNLGLLVFRVGFAGILIWLHGWARMLRAGNFLFFGQPWTFVGLVERLGFPIPAFFAVASATAESIGAFLVLIGFLTRPAALTIAISMGVATWSEAAKGDPWELPSLYLLGAITLVIAGGGSYSAGNLLRSVRKK